MIHIIFPIYRTSLHLRVSSLLLWRGGGLWCRVQSPINWIHACLAQQLVGFGKVFAAEEQALWIGRGVPCFEHVMFLCDRSVTELQIRQWQLPWHRSVRPWLARIFPTTKTRVLCAVLRAVWSLHRWSSPSLQMTRVSQWLARRNNSYLCPDAH